MVLPFYTAACNKQLETTLKEHNGMPEPKVGQDVFKCGMPKFQLTKLVQPATGAHKDLQRALEWMTNSLGPISEDGMYRMMQAYDKLPVTAATSPTDVLRYQRHAMCTIFKEHGDLIGRERLLFGAKRLPPVGLPPLTHQEIV